jgi:hypothetical protein
MSSEMAVVIESKQSELLRGKHKTSGGRRIPTENNPRPENRKSDSESDDTLFDRAVERYDKRRV